MNTPYEDLQFLEKNGHWAAKTIPDWVQKIVEKYNCSPASNYVVIQALKYEIDRLNNDLRNLYLQQTKKE